MKLKTILQKAAGGGCPALHLVLNHVGTPIGHLEKFPNVAGKTHPWKAFVQSGWASGGDWKAEFVGEFYGKNGKVDALNAIAKRLLDGWVKC